MTAAPPCPPEGDSALQPPGRAEERSVIGRGPGSAPCRRMTAAPSCAPEGASALQPLPVGPKSAASSAVAHRVSALEVGVAPEALGEGAEHLLALGHRDPALAHRVLGGVAEAAEQVVGLVLHIAQ